MMRGIWQRFGKEVRFAELIRSANIRINDLPTIDWHVGPTGNNCLCFNHILGHCPHMVRGVCTFDHVLGTDLSNNFVDKLCRLVTPGVDTILNGGTGGNNNNNNNNRGDNRGAGTTLDNDDTDRLERR